MKNGSERKTAYNPEIWTIDEQICSLLAQQKERLPNRSGMPSPEIISILAEKYGLHVES